MKKKTVRVVEQCFVPTRRVFCVAKFVGLPFRDPMQEARVTLKKIRSTMTSHTACATTRTVDGEIQVTQLSSKDVEEAATVMARAFANSPIYSFILMRFQDEEARVAVLQWLFNKNLNLMLHRCPSACKCVRIKAKNDDADADQKIVATFMWTPREHEHIDTWTLIRWVGGLELPFRLGWTGIRNLLRTLDEFQDIWKDAMEKLKTDDNNSTSHSWITLERMTVLPEYQGKGIGSAALQHVLQDETDSQNGSPKRLVRLATQEQRNVRFYERLGFQTVAERNLVQDRSDTGYRSWFMVKELSKE